MKTYKLEFESVLPFGEKARFYNGDKPNCRPEDVPDQYWTKAANETDNPWQQYNTLKEWAKSGEHLIRNVQLFEAEKQVTDWTPVGSTPAPAATGEPERGSPCVICGNDITSTDTYGVGKGGRYHLDCIRAEAATVSATGDTARLEAVIRNRWTITWNSLHNAFIVQQPEQVVGNIAHGPLRAAIDAAMGKEQP